MRRFLRENGLSIAMFGLFVACLVGQIVAGEHDYNEEQQTHGQATVGYLAYLRTGHFVEALFENWESEFLQMGAYVMLTVHLRQKGSPESKGFDEPEECDADPQNPPKPDAPWPVQRGGWVLKLYENSLTVSLLLLFVVSFVLHALGGARAYSQEQVESGQPAVSLLQFVESSRFWFQSFQNWQSEFLSIGVLVVLSIFLRQKGSPESKAVDAPNDLTGGD